uniref:Ubiquitin carboxyl-terminal hydrolase MINDY n=1 Tax=Cynoglossus semilaevis TaxID=244447 RepID=A0A3P8W6A8_CYNSE
MNGCRHLPLSGLWRSRNSSSPSSPCLTTTQGLKRTIACMDEEHPRTDASINNRSHLRTILNMEHLYKDNKAQSSPFKTLLEIIVKHHISGPHHSKVSSESSVGLSSFPSPQVAPAVLKRTKPRDGTADVFTNSQTNLRSDVEDISFFSQQMYTSSVLEADSLPRNNQTHLRACDSEDHKGHPLLAPLPDNKSVLRRESEHKTLINESTQRSKANRIRRGMMAGPIASTSQESSKKKPSRRVETPQLRLRKKEELLSSGDGLLPTDSHQIKTVVGLSAMVLADREAVRREDVFLSLEKMQSENSFEQTGQDSLKTTKMKSRTNQGDLDVTEMVLDDIDDDLPELSRVSPQRPVRAQSYTGSPIDLHTARELKTVLLGSSQQCFSAEWRNQGFTFSETHDLRYGIVQKKGGPCGVLASVQAFVLKKMLFEDPESVDAGPRSLTPSTGARRKYLVFALAEILWRAGQEERATVAVNSGRTHFSSTGRYRPESVLEKISIFSVESAEELQMLLEQHIEQFESAELGCLLLTVSAVLSRTIEKVKEDMDVPTTTLIGAHGYCTQELVNLLLCGRAVSNVFDGDMELDSGNGNVTLLKGIKGQCEVGLLSLFEHYNICKVGAHMKTPHCPIWVVCSESHFSVLFGLQRELLTNPDRYLEFDLYYYDGLANQQEEIRLTVSVSKSTVSQRDLDTDLTPPLEHCIQTRWPGAVVSWNDTEPIL